MESISLAINTIANVPLKLDKVLLTSREDRNYILITYKLISRFIIIIYLLYAFVNFFHLKNVLRQRITVNFK